MTRKRPPVTLGALDASQSRPSLLAGFTGQADVPVISLPLAQIRPRAGQPRRSFAPEGLQRLADSIRLHGVIQPLTVHRTPEGYQLVAGERRWRAAQEAGLTEVPVRVLHDLTTSQLQQYSAVENLQREDLNAVDEADAVLDILEAQLGLPRTELTPRLERLKSLKMRDPQLLKVSGGDRELLEQVETAFTGLGRGAWTSFVSNRLPVLRLPDDLLTEVRSGTLEYTKAVALRNVTPEERPAMIALARASSLTELRARLRPTPAESGGREHASEEIGATLARLAQSGLNHLTPAEQRKVTRLLREVDDLIGQKGKAD